MPGCPNARVRLGSLARSSWRDRASSLSSIQRQAFEGSGLPLHSDGESVIKERIFLDKAKPDLLHDEITTIDHALTRPWTVTKSYRRERNAVWLPNECAEDNHHVTIGKDDYFISADGLLMPTKKDQPPPDLRYFRQSKK